MSLQIFHTLVIEGGGLSHWIKKKQVLFLVLMLVKAHRFSVLLIPADLTTTLTLLY